MTLGGKLIGVALAGGLITTAVGAWAVFGAARASYVTAVEKTSSEHVQNVDVEAAAVARRLAVRLTPLIFFAYSGVVALFWLVGAQVFKWPPARMGRTQGTETPPSVEQSRLHDLVENMSNGVLMLDSTRNVVLVNPMMRHMLGKSEEDVLDFGQFLGALRQVSSAGGRRRAVPLPPERLEAAVAEAKRTGRAVRIEELPVRRHVFDVFVSPVGGAFHRTVGTAIIFHDITQLKEVERLRTDFMNIAAHDLRTPVTAVKGYVQMIRRGEFGPPPGGELGEALADIEEGADRIVSLVNDFLTVSRLEQGRLTVAVAATDLRDILGEVMREVQFTVRDRPEISVAVDLPEDLPRVSADREKIVQVLINLLDNALKYTEKGPIRVAARQAEGRFVEISVADTGIGIHPDDLPHVFEPYFKGRGKEVAAGRGAGLGLGLYIVKIILDRHEGKVWVESERGKGTVVRLTLPIATESAQGKAQSARDGG